MPFQTYIRNGIRIVMACGYDSESFFKKLFRARTGVTMREYRKAHAR